MTKAHSWGGCQSHVCRGVSRLHKLVLLPASRAAPPARQGFQVLVEVDVALFHGFEGMFVSVAM